MASILIKDTTREQREQIVRESLGDEYDVGCGYESTGINYQLYIDGIKELRELNMEANCGFEVAHPEEKKSGCNLIYGKDRQMVKHIILWILKEMSDSEKESVKAGIKEGLESLKGKIPGLVDIKVNTSDRLPSSTADLMLDSTFESAEALKGYSKHPEHVAVADSKVRPFTASRACLDFEI